MVTLSALLLVTVPTWVPTVNVSTRPPLTPLEIANRSYPRGSVSPVNVSIHGPGWASVIWLSKTFGLFVPQLPVLPTEVNETPVLAPEEFLSTTLVGASEPRTAQPFQLVPVSAVCGPVPV